MSAGVGGGLCCQTLQEVLVKQLLAFTWSRVSFGFSGGEGTQGTARAAGAELPACIDPVPLLGCCACVRLGGLAVIVVQPEQPKAEGKEDEYGKGTQCKREM